MRTAVVILNWNGEALLQRYLPEVVANTTAPGAEVIVADNASTDGSVAYVRRAYPQVGIIQLDANYGFAGGYNRAIAQLDHDLVLLLNSDVAPAPGYLEPLVELMAKDPSVAVCGPKLLDDKRRTHFEYAGAAGGLVDMLCYPFCRGRMWDKVEADEGQYDGDADVLWVSGAALLVRRMLYEECGGLDERFFAHQEEIDMCWRLCNMGHRVVAVGSSAVYHLGGATLGAANPRKTYLNFRNNLAMLVKNYNTWYWWIVLSVRLLLDGVAGLRFIMQGKWSHCVAIVKAHWSFFSWVPRLMVQRWRLPRESRLPVGVSRKLILLKMII